MVPVGVTGVRLTPVNDAVKVTCVFTAEGLAGAGDRVIEGVAAFTVMLAVPVDMA